LIFFRPVSEAGRRGIEELENQTSHLLSFQAIGRPVFGTQVAFNLLDNYGQDSTESLPKVRQRIRKELGLLAGAGGVLPSIEVVHAPVFYGYTFAAFAETAPAAPRDRVAEACHKAGFLVRKNDEGPLGNLSADDTAMRLAIPEDDSSHSAAWWSWGAVDNIKLPAANAVRLAELLSR
jgi:aspartate-semialdehyde dehydrogenase